MHRRIASASLKINFEHKKQGSLPDFYGLQDLGEIFLT
jgi:hypothetical protein